MFKYYVKSEILKVIYNKWILFSAFVTILFIPFMVCILKDLTQSAGILEHKSRLLQAFYLGQIWFVVISSLYFGQEYKSSSLRTSLLLIPNRTLTIITKIAVCICFIVVLLCISTIFSIVAVCFYFNFFMTINTIVNLVSILFPVYISIIELSIISAGFIIICKSYVAAISFFLPLLLGLGQMLLQFSPIFMFIPGISTMNVFLLKNSSLYLSETNGIFCQGIWLAVILLTASILFKSRCIK